MPQPLAWLPGVLSLPSAARLAASPAYKAGSVYGIDAASAAAVRALAPAPGDVVLDLCCAPGAKLCMISDCVSPPPSPESPESPEGGGAPRSGFVVGVDVSEPRLSATRTLLRKYGQSNVRLFLADGAAFSAPCPRPASEDAAREERGAMLRAFAEARQEGQEGASKRRKRGRKPPPRATQVLSGHMINSKEKGLSNQILP